MRHTSLHLFMNDSDMCDTVSCEGLVNFRGEEGMEVILWRKILYKLELYSHILISGDFVFIFFKLGFCCFEPQ